MKFRLAIKLSRPTCLSLTLAVL